MDRRINPDEDLAEEKQRLLVMFDQLKEQGIDLEIEVFQEAPSSGVSETHPLAQTLARTIATVTGNAPAFEMRPGLLEIRWYAQLGIPVKNIAESVLIYAMTAVQLLGEGWWYAEKGFESGV